MDRHRIRNLIPPAYGALVVAAVFVSVGVGVALLIVSAMLSGLVWSVLSGSSARGPQ